jgi:hypothetical protein
MARHSKKRIAEKLGQSILSPPPVDFAVSKVHAASLPVRNDDVDDIVLKEKSL